MSHTAILTRAEIESMGPPLPEELADTGISEQFFCDLTLKHVAMLPEADDAGSRRTYQSSAHADRRSASEALPRKADRR